MSRFFDSEVVRESLKELDALQTKVFNQLLYLPFAETKDKRKYLELMKEFLEKQKLFIFRLSLSDDPEALEMKEKIMHHAELFGFKPEQGINAFFEQMEKSLKTIERSLDV
jgi:hypothetical protein